MEEYIKNLRKKIGHDKVILNYAGCVFFTDDGKIVLQKRSDCNEWGFFGGMVELGESLEEAAIREVKEESGYNVEITSLYGIYSKYFATYSNGDEAQTVCTLFKAEIVGGEAIVSNSETNEIGYFDLSNPPKMFCKQHQDILDDIISGKDIANFATVSGKIDNISKPERLYRKCGFTGSDIWHILIKR